MFKARKRYKKILRIKFNRKAQRKRFQNDFVSLFRKKPAKREKRIDKLMSDERAMLLRERILIDPMMPNENHEYLAQSSGWMRHKPGPGGLLQFAISDNYNVGFQDKTMQAIRFIQQH